MTNLFTISLRTPWRCLQIFVLCSCVFLSACKKDLYSNLNEVGANEMLVTLLENGVGSAGKDTDDGGKTWVLHVDESQLVRAMQVLQQNGLPRTGHDTLGDLFKKDGLVSTPAEERIRFIYGLSEELDSTLSQIDGVLVARVQIVLPNNDPLATDVKPSSASVFIKSRPGSAVDRMVPQVKALVVHSVEGLSYDQVSVVVVPADQVQQVLGKNSDSHWLVWIETAGGALLLLMGVIAFLFREKLRFDALLGRHLPVTEDSDRL